MFLLLFKLLCFLDIAITKKMSKLSNNYFSIVCYYHIRYEFQSESTLYSFPEFQGTSCLKHIRNNQPFCGTGRMIELCCEYLSVKCIILHVIITSRTSFRVYLHSVVQTLKTQSAHYSTN